MLTIGETIKILMDEHGIKVPALSELTGLKESAILNVIYNRTNKAEYLSRIAKVLNIPVQTLLQSKKTTLIEANTYFAVNSIIKETLEEMGINLIQSKLLEEYTDSLYKAMLINKDPHYHKAYLKGMIESNIKLGFIKADSKIEKKIHTQV